MDIRTAVMVFLIGTGIGVYTSAAWMLINHEVDVERKQTW